MLSTRCIRSLGWLTLSTVIWTTVLSVLLFLGAAPHFDDSSRTSEHIIYSVNDTTRRIRYGDDHSATSRATSTSKQSIHGTNKTGLGPHRCVIANGTKLRLITRGTQYGHSASDQSAGKNVQNTPVKLILKWTKFYGRSWGVPQGRHIFEDLRCPVKECSITDDKSLVDSAHAMIVHMRDISDPSQLPTRRTQQQRWIFYNLESPHHTETNLTKFNGLFNWTSTYSSESDIPSPYGKYQTFDKYTQFNKNETEGPRYTRSLSQRHATKSRLGAWFVTNCKAKNNRKEYVDALRKNMLIDIYGFCGNFKCHDRESCLDMLKQKYKFYIAFENSNCREYISEKFWYNALEHNILPVVMGASTEDYEKAAPPHSYIHVDDFPSAKDLARYLKLLHKDTRLYNEYFRWQHQGTASSQINYLPSKSTYWCDLCAALHDDKLPQKVHWDLDKWWSVEEQCWS